MLVSPDFKQYVVPVLIWCGVVAVILGGGLFMAIAASDELALSDTFVIDQSGSRIAGESCLAFH